MKRDLTLLLILALLALAIAGGFSAALGQEASRFEPAEARPASYPRPPRDARPEAAPPSEPAPAPARPAATGDAGSFLRDQPLTLALIVGVVCVVAIVVAGKQTAPTALGHVGTTYGRHLFLIAAVVALCVSTYLYATTQYVHAAMAVVMALLGFGLWHHHGGRPGP